MQTRQASSRISLSNILVATDFSQASKVALPYAVVLARQYEAKVFVAHAVSLEPHLSVPLDPLPLKADPLWQEAEQRLAKFVHTDLLDSTPHESLLQRGDFWSVISDIIEKNKIDLVVAGSHGREGLGKVVLGSNAEKIYRRATCPVLTVGPKVPPLTDTNWELKQILFPTDGSEVSLKALPYALSLAEENQANLIFLQLLAEARSRYTESDGTSAREALRLLVPAEAQVWCKSEFVVRFEFPAEGILGLAQEHEANLIVMGVKKSGQAAMSGHLPWPIASQVVAQVSCPVLTVRG
jgi:nucleotide-binding universal stress UspA family protein